MNTELDGQNRSGAAGWLDRAVEACLTHKLVTVIVLAGIIGAGIVVAPFDWSGTGLPRYPVAVDAIPDIGENQQIVFTAWPGRSPQDVEDQITYPLTVSLLGIPSVETIRSYSYLGYSTIFIVFKEDAEFYWSRSRILEKLNSLPADTLPEDVQPSLGPDATSLGQVFWYTLEGRDPDGNPVGGWDLHELRTLQDWHVRYALMGAEGVSEVASIGGFVKEYQIDVDPDAMRAFNVSLEDVFSAVRMSNVDVGARTIEVNRVEYVVRGLGFIESIEDIEDIVVAVEDNVPVYVRQIAHVTAGPATRRGALDKGGAEAVGGVVVARYGSNPLQVIKNTKAKIAEIAPGLPSRAVLTDPDVPQATVDAFAQRHGFQPWDGAELNQEAWLAWLNEHPRGQWPSWITKSTIDVVPFYDRTELIYETLNTLGSALTHQILITMIVIVLMLMHLRSSMLVSAMLPLAVLMSFLGMKAAGVDANIVALSGIAIAIGTIVDMGIIVCENIVRHLEERGHTTSVFDAILDGTREVSGAVLTAVATTVVSFLPVFTMTGPEGKLFTPLAYTKTFALIASVIVALFVLPMVAHLVFGFRLSSALHRWFMAGLAAAAAIVCWRAGWFPLAILFAALIAVPFAARFMPERWRRWTAHFGHYALALVLAAVLASLWTPLSILAGLPANFLFVVLIVGIVLGVFWLFRRTYAPTLAWSLEHKWTYLVIPGFIVLIGMSAWRGFHWTFAPVPAAASAVGMEPSTVHETAAWQAGTRAFPGLGTEFMPNLDEGAFLWMPTTMPHASIGEALEVLQYQDKAIAAIPEVKTAVGKIGRVDSPLDPAPVSMIETLVTYHPEYKVEPGGEIGHYAYDAETGRYLRDEAGRLIPSPDGKPFRLWRDHIQSPDDIWDAIVDAAEMPGTTSAPKLHPIKARTVMLQSGMRAPMGVKIKGPDLESIESTGLAIEQLLKEVPGVAPATVYADRIVGKPYLEIDIDRQAIARYGLHIRDVQDVIEVAIGGRMITRTVEGRERFAVRVRYLRELRDQVERMKRILVAAPGGTQIPLEQVAEIRYVRGPQVIKSEDTFLVGYVLFDKQSGSAEIDVVEACQAYLNAKLDSGELVLPEGVSYAFAGNYENQLHAQRTLNIVLPVSLAVIFVLLYLQFGSGATALLVFSGILVAWSGGFILMWLYGQPWFLDVTVFGNNIREVFQIQPINLSVAVWVGFLALFGIASDNGVVMATYLDQAFRRNRPQSVEAVREAAMEAGERRVRPCLMTTATTLLALLPVMTSTGKGSDIMAPMAIPAFGGMFASLISLFMVPVLYCMLEEWKLRAGHEAQTSVDAQG